ncbi:hypothetical protein CD241_0579 [Corynebacterium diphtheriae 241]|nr:hypothetical protein CD241_0579 [Corynebacterium diphtheriae 241]
MANKGIVPVKISLTEGDFYTLWAPQWREHGAEWQAFLGSGDDLYVFESPAAVLAYIESGARHDLSDHPKWGAFMAGADDRVVPTDRQEYDLIGVPALLAERPSHTNVSAVARCFAITRSLGDVTATIPVQSFFSSHSILMNTERGGNHFTGDSGLGEWTGIGRIVLTSWNNVIDALDSAITVHTDGNAEAISAAAARIDAATAEAEQRRIAEEKRKRPTLKKSTLTTPPHGQPQVSTPSRSPSMGAPSIPCAPTSKHSPYS